MSPLREEQAAATRERILAAIAELLAEGGLHDFSIPQVAARAGVARRTVFRYFPTREELLEAMGEWYERAFRVEMPESVDGMGARVITVFEMFDGRPELVQGVLNSPVGSAIRMRGRSRRIRAIERLVNEVTAGLPAKQRRQVNALVNSLVSSQTWKTMREEHGLSGREAGEAVAWVLDALFAEVRRHRRTDGEAPASR